MRSRRWQNDRSKEPRNESRRGHGPGRTLGIIVWVVAPVAAIGVLLVLTLRSTIVAPDKHDRAPAAGRQENYLATVRSTLARQNDLAACKTVVPQLNAHLERNKDHTPPAFPETKEMLRGQMGLKEDDLAEVASPTFTPLDAHHLESCFLLRDAARSLELATPGGRGGKVKQTPLDRAELAFAWVVRQVRLQAPPPGSTAPAPPAFVLHGAGALTWSGRWSTWPCSSNSASTRTPRLVCKGRWSSFRPRADNLVCGPAAWRSARSRRRCTCSICAWDCPCPGRAAREWPRWRKPGTIPASWVSCRWARRATT